MGNASELASSGSVSLPRDIKLAWRVGFIRQSKGAASAVLATTMALATTSCFNDPGMSVDIKPLGDAPLGKLLSRKWMNGERYIEEDLRAWLSGQPNSANCVASVPRLQSLGFQTCSAIAAQVHGPIRQQ